MLPTVKPFSCLWTESSGSCSHFCISSFPPAYFNFPPSDAHNWPPAVPWQFSAPLPLQNSVVTTFEGALTPSHPQTPGPPLDLFALPLSLTGIPSISPTCSPHHFSPSGLFAHMSPSLHMSPLPHTSPLPCISPLSYTSLPPHMSPLPCTSPLLHTSPLPCISPLLCTSPLPHTSPLLCTSPSPHMSPLLQPFDPDTAPGSLYSPTDVFNAATHAECNPEMVVQEVRTHPSLSLPQKATAKLRQDAAQEKNAVLIEDLNSLLKRHSQEKEDLAC